jgi:hypothetical protein
MEREFLLEMRMGETGFHAAHGWAGLFGTGFHAAHGEEKKIGTGFQDLQDGQDFWKARFHAAHGWTGLLEDKISCCAWMGRIIGDRIAGLLGRKDVYLDRISGFAGRT